MNRPAAGPAAAFAALLLSFAPSTVTAMHEDPAALRLDIRRQGDALEVKLIGDAPAARQVSYLLEVSGQSTSRHRGKTTLAAGAPTVLATVKATAREKWCVRLLAEEDGREPYEIIEGDCDLDE